MKLEITVNPNKNPNKWNGLEGFANVVFDGQYALENVQIKSKDRDCLYIVLPEIVKKTGDRKEIFHPTTAQARMELDKSIIQAYQNAKNGQKKTEFTNDLPHMKISGVNSAQFERDYIIGLANVKFSDCFVLEGAQIKTGAYGEYVDMPKFRRNVMENGKCVYDEKGIPKTEYRAVFKPITKESAAELKESVVNAFNKKYMNRSQHEEIIDDYSNSRNR